MYKKFTESSTPHRDHMEGKEARQLAFIEHLLCARLSNLCANYFLLSIIVSLWNLNCYLHFTVNDAAETLKVKKLAQGYSAGILTDENVFGSKTEVLSIISYGPSWKKRADIITSNFRESNMNQIECFQVQVTATLTNEVQE